jgi:hypothetical protein
VPLWLALLRTYSTTSCIYKSSKKLIAKEVFFASYSCFSKKKCSLYRLNDNGGSGGKEGFKRCNVCKWKKMKKIFNDN